MDELLAAVVAAPDDDGPRHVLADYLQQCGDPWGELIVLGCELARRDDAALGARYDELWAERFPDGTHVRHFERGFCTKLESSSLASVTGAEYALVRTAALVDAVEDNLRALARWPLLAQIEALNLEAKQDVESLGPEVPPVIAAAHRLHTLELMCMDVSREDIDAILALPHARQLRTLAIMANHPIDELGGIAWPTLDALDFGACTLSDWDVEDLLDSDALTSLSSLELSFNPIDDRAARALARYPFAQLATLELQGTDITGAGIAALAAAPPLRGLTRFAIGGGHFDDIDDALPVLAGAFPELVALRVEARRSLPHLAMLARPLRELALQVETIDTAALAALLAHPALRDLERLELELEVPLYGDAIAEVIAAVELPQLMQLRLNSCGVGPQGGRALATAAHLPRTMDLMIYGRDEDVGDAAEPLRARYNTVDV